LDVGIRATGGLIDFLGENMANYPNSPIGLRRLMSKLHADNRAEARKYCRFEFHMIDRATSLLFDLLLIAQDKNSAGEVVTWPDIKPAFRRPCPDGIVMATLSALLDSIVATRELAMMGLDNPSRNALRMVSEISEFATCILGSKSFFEAFRKCSGTVRNSYENWKTLLKPSKLRKAAIDVRIKMGISMELAHQHSIEKGEEYQFLSKSAHLSFDGLMCGNYRRYSDAKEAVMVPSFLGMIGPSTRGTVRILADEASLSVMCIAKLLFTQHDFCSGANESQRRSFFRLPSLNTAYQRYLDYLDMAAYPGSSTLPRAKVSTSNAT
jgi:hypothetical protein